MSEEDLQEGSALDGLRSRAAPSRLRDGLPVVNSNEVLVDSGAEVDEEENDDIVRGKLLDLLDRDVLACDIQLSLFIAAATSYRHDSTLRPYPTFFMLPTGEKDIVGLQSLLDSLPNTKELRSQLESNNYPTSTNVALRNRLLLWILNGSGLRLRTLHRDEADRVMNLAGDMSKHSKPDYVLEVTTPATKSGSTISLLREAWSRLHMHLCRWEKRILNNPSLWAFHGSRLDNFHSILHFGLQQHRTKTSLFGEGIYLARDLGVCLTYSSRGIGWPKSLLGNTVSAVALAQVQDHPTQVNLHSSDARGEVEGSNGGRVPDMYVVVRNNELLHIKYLLLYRHETISTSLGSSRLLAWMGRHKMILLLLAYAIMLGLIGLSNSQWLRRWFKRNGFTS